MLKKDGLQIVTTALCTALLVVTISQSRKLEEYRGQLENRMNSVEQSLESSIQNAVYNVTRELEEANNPILSWEMIPVEIDSENRGLMANAVLQLKHWQKDTVICLETEVGPDKHILALPVDSTGNCVGTMYFPIHGRCEVKLAAAITGGGETTRVDLGGWGDISMLLPVQINSHGGSVPTYRGGNLVIDQYVVHPEDPNGRPAAVVDGVYRLYLNGELGKEDARCANWVHPCEAGDEVHLTFACKDEFGLGYEFALGIWRVPEKGDLLEEVPAEIETRPTLTWD